MPFQKGKPRPAGSGRKKGSANKTTKDLKEAILGAFEKVGGQEYLVRMARKNPAVFSGLLGKVLPTQINADIRSVSLDAYVVAIGGDVTRAALTGGQQESTETQV